MPAYLIVDIASVRDAELYAKYRFRVSEGLEAAGGRYLVRGGMLDVFHGRWAPSRVVVVRFPSLVAASDWWGSPGYAELKELRQRATHTRMLVSVDRDGPDPVTGAMAPLNAAPGYVLLEVMPEAEHRSSAGFAELLHQSVAKSHGSVLCTGDIVRPLEGDWAPHRIALARFASLDAARHWWTSSAAVMRGSAPHWSAANVVAVEGLC